MQTPIDFYLSYDIIQIEASSEAKNGKSGGILVSGVKGKSGGARKGTRPIIKRIPDLFDIGVQFFEPHQFDIDELSMGKCPMCGAVWWSDYTVYVRAATPEASGNAGVAYPVLSKIRVDGQPEKHHRDCPMK